MDPQIWNPDKALDIFAFGKYDMFCVGVAVTRGNARCGWRIPVHRRSQVCSILDKMATTPPKEISPQLLSRLATLSLCEERHQYQHHDILKRWDVMIKKVANQSGEKEELERHHREFTTEPVIKSEDPKQLSARLAELNSQFTESKARESDLLLQVEEFKHSLTKSRGDAECLAKQGAELSHQLSKERHILAQCQLDHEVTTKQVDELQSQLSTHRQVSEQLSRDLNKATADRQGLLAQTESLRAQSAIESQSLNQVKRKLEQVETTQAALLKERNTLQSQLATESQSSEQVKKDLEETLTTQAALLRDQKTLQSQLATERQTSSQLTKTLESLETKLASSQATLERTQLDLTQSQKAIEEQAAADAAARAATAQLHERIWQLEAQSRVSVLSAVVGRIKGLGGRVVLWATGGRWPRRRNGTGGEDMV